MYIWLYYRDKSKQCLKKNKNSKLTAYLNGQTNRKLFRRFAFYLSKHKGTDKRNG